MFVEQPLALPGYAKHLSAFNSLSGDKRQKQYGGMIIVITWKASVAVTLSDNADLREVLSKME